jgi:hypothetical protein
MTTAQLQEYRAYRAKGHKASWSLRWAKMATAEFKRKFERDGFAFEVHTEYDDCCSYDLDHLGTWTDEWEPGAIDHRAREGRNAWAERSTYRWFVPQVSEADRREMYHKDGASRHEAYTKARASVMEDYERAWSCGEQWSMMRMIVTASRSGIELGRAVIHGIESDGEESHFAETAEELSYEAQDEAEAALDGLAQGLKCPQCGHSLPSDEAN